MGHWTDIFQKVYNFFDTLDSTWIGDFLRVVGKILASFLERAGAAYIGEISEKILSTQDAYAGASGDEKFGIVFDFAHTLLPEWKESELDTLIQTIFMKLKDAKKL